MFTISILSLPCLFPCHSISSLLHSSSLPSSLLHSSSLHIHFGGCPSVRFVLTLNPVKENSRLSLFILIFYFFFVYSFLSFSLSIHFSCLLLSIYLYFSLHFFLLSSSLPVFLSLSLFLPSSISHSSQQQWME